MEIATEICYTSLRIARYSVDFISSKAFNWFYDGKWEELPPIKSSHLLEPAIVLAKRIRQREVRMNIFLLLF